MILSDNELKRIKCIITPFNEERCNTLEVDDKLIKIPSKGLSSCGYDVALANEFKVPIKHNNLVDVLEEDWSSYYRDLVTDTPVIAPYGFILGRTEETICMPSNLTASLFCKSTLARRGVSLPPTIIEPGWCGKLVIEIFNMNPFKIQLRAGIGIGQIIFFNINETPNEVYNDTRKYQNQQGVTIGLL